MYQNIPKAELHTHLEATASPQMVLQKAKQNGVDAPDLSFVHPDHRWDGLGPFVEAYDKVANAFRTEQDYTDLTYDYLKRCAADNAIYVELIASPAHAGQFGISYVQMVEAIEKGISRAKEEFDIESRILITAVRNIGPDHAIEVAQMAADNPHHLVTGFGIAGSEDAGEFIDFKKAFTIAQDKASLFCHAHAGEATGPDNMRRALNHLPITRIGHGVRAAEDPDLMRELIKRNITLEVCPSSNIVLGFYPDHDSHPLKYFRMAGVKTTLNTDDPIFFNATLGGEYEIAAKYHGYSKQDLWQATRNAIEAAFVDEATRAKLLTKLDDQRPRSIRRPSRQP